MSFEKITKLSIIVGENDVVGGAKKVVSLVRPNWSLDKVKFKVFTDGITNKLVGCQEESDADKNDVILVRIYGESTDLIIDRSMEIKNMLVMQAAGCARPIFARFDNGIVYGFQPGVCLNVETIRQTDIARLVAREMARMHAIDPDKLIGGGNGKSSDYDRSPFVFRKMVQYLNLVPDEYSDPKQNKRFKSEVPERSALFSEIEQLRAHLVALPMRVVFTHNDLLLNNLVLNDKRDRVYFIDFEYGAFNHDAYDIGNHFCEWAGVDTVDYSLYPGKSEQLAWLRGYLECRRELEGRGRDDVTESELNELYVQVNKCALAAHLFWGIWGLIQAHFSKIDFDYLDYGIIRLREYFARKEEVLAL